MRSPGRKGIYADHMQLLLVWLIAVMCWNDSDSEGTYFILQNLLSTGMLVYPITGAPFRNSISRKPLPVEPLQGLVQWGGSIAICEGLWREGRMVRWRKSNEILRAQGKHLVIATAIDKNIIGVKKHEEPLRL